MSCWLATEYRKSSHLLTAMQLDGLEYLELPRPAADRYRYLAFVREETFQVRFEAEPARRESEGIGIPLRATYDGRPVTVDVSVYTGAGMTYARIREGRGYLELHRMPDELLVPRQELHLQVRYAYEGRMLQFSEIEALHEVFRDRPLDTWVRVEVVFPFVEDTKPEPKVPAGPPAAAPGKRADWPLPIVILADQPGTRELLDGLQAYQRQGRLRFLARRPAPGLHELYVAVADEQQVRGIFLVEPEGFVDVRRQRRLTSLQEYAGARQIWIVPSQP